MKAVVRVGGKQFIVAEKETLMVDLLPEGTKELTLEPLMVFTDKDTTIGDPVVKGASVKASVVEPLVKGEKLRVIRYKAKKRVHKVNGHRQKHSQIMIDSITTK